MIDSLLKLPLTIAPVDPAKGTQCVHLELWLRDKFAIPDGNSIFAVVPALEAYSPPLPLVLLNTVAHRMLEELHDGQEMPIVDYALIVRPLVSLSKPIPPSSEPSSPFFPINGAALSRRDNSVEQQHAQLDFVDKMRTFGFARIEVTPEQAGIPIEAFRAVRKWLRDQLVLPPEQRWSERVDATDYVPSDEDEKPRSPFQSLMCWSKPSKDEPMSLVSKGRYVGFNGDATREYLQMRRPLAASGTVWPRPYFVDAKQEDFAAQMLSLLNLLDGIGRDCMEAVCNILNIDRDWMFHELLDSDAPPPASDADVTTTDLTRRYGASVLRIYNYKNKKGEFVDPNRLDINMSCGSHADLGLVTVSPCATVPGLQMWNLDRMLWTDVEADADVIHFSVFAGETLAYITNGLISAPLHRVPATVVDDELSRRMSMPYFLRATPQSILNPSRPKGTPALTTRDFMEDVVFKKRPWRRDSCATPDY
ncbi:hypothetical protein SPRG_04808 [Saprolegnia parasitica CBS 223.65]|uniref:Fe2OG dioxygenase domain-containing protein n=1 Tax=Saprolegnia parasitica (strain CBS 223.65) TaxID=695850 RepID=A0A067CNT3_SAPPC|nr:hypothetical protein SPRG_04808 [Saprolegnia parasitica CBS 223.65]KDO30905.1 hypothetical protein SPRG_04808 [Saprolegnia parasitica CBS 223.65]|eukprot:XP_012198598.1 hypothetical protein SPRG_04808 [Saprolegnia parasitica CBS 223.65]